MHCSNLAIYLLTKTLAAECEKNTNYGCINFQHMNIKLSKRNMNCFKGKSKKYFGIILP